jgi:hypothetical protein
MGKKTYSKHQKVYKMKGCSTKTRKNYLGGSADINLAYPGNNVPTVPNPYLAYTGKGVYTGKGGSSCGGYLTPNLNIPSNINGVDKTVPNTGPTPIFPATPFLNPVGSQRGGCCGTCGVTVMTGGSCLSCSAPLMGGSRKKKGGCGTCASGLMIGGTRHRLGCKCSSCKSKRGSANMKGGNPGIPYPDGLVGKPWTPSISGWPGVNGVQGDSNYLALNTYTKDPQTAMIATGANPPFSIGGSKNRTKKQRGGTISNFLTQDLINLGRQFQFGVGSAYNALAGYSSPVNPMPWKDQLPNTSSLNTLKAAYI